MKTKTLKTLFFTSAMFLVGCSAGSLSRSVTLNAGGIFSDVDALLRTKSEYQDPNDDSGKKGLLIYGYDSGDSINFGCSYSGVFTASLKPIVNDYGSIDLKEFSILFTEKTTMEQFSIKVFVGSTQYYVAVCKDGQFAGINYYETDYSVGQHFGYTSIANNEGRYTKVFTDQTIDLSFNPSTMVVQTKLSDNSYHDVWNFKEAYNDGKYLETLSTFDQYDISLIFDKVSSNGCADLLAYSFAGYDLSSATISSASPVINPHIKTNAILGQKYQFPVPTITSPYAGELNGEDVNISLYNKYGEQVALSNRSFVPELEGKYYAYYSYNKNGLTSSTYYCLTVEDPLKINVEFSDPYFDLYQGMGQKIVVPEATITSNIGTNDTTFNCDVTISRNGSVLDGYEKAKAGGEFTFSQKGTYTFVYSNDLFEETITRTVVVDGRIAINEINKDVVFNIGDTFEIPEIEFVKNGRNVSYRAKVFSPLGEELSVPFVISQEGYYQVSYDLDSESAPFVKEYVVHKDVSSLFTNGSAEYSTFTVDNRISGAKLSISNNEVVTYNKTINLNKFGFNTSLSDPSKNQELLHLYIQPKTQGLADLDSLFVQLTDANNPGNFITIRMKYLAYFPGGSMIRARASGQGAYVGYYYDFYSTTLHADNATSHEEGGFISLINFTARQSGLEASETGFPLYFDSAAGRLYSRPAWLTGHNAKEGDNYNDIQVPWLVYDFKTDDANLNGGNSPWKGFSTGEIYLSIYGKGISSSADIIVSSIDGKDLSEKYIVDEDKPTITVDDSEMTYSEADGNYSTPNAKVGTSYPIFDFTATDETSSIKEKSVTVLDPSGKNVSISNNSFVPEQEGKYQIVYSAKDIFGNESKKVVDVYAFTTYSPIGISLNSSLPSSIYYGQELALPSATYSGGNGRLKLNVTVTSNTGVSVPVTNMKLKALVPGTSYNIDYCVTDYLGQEKHLVTGVQVELSDSVIFDEDSLVLPSAFIHGTEYRFNTLVGVYYDSDYQGHSVTANISIKDAKGTTNVGSDLSYVPSYSDSVTNADVTVSFNQGKKLEISRIIPIVKPKTNNSGYMSSFFLSENAEVTPSAKGLTFASNGANTMSFEFIREIDATDLLIDMTLNKEKFSFSSFDIVLKDMYNANERVRLTYNYHYDEFAGVSRLFVSLNGSSVENVVNTGSDNVLRISYNSSTYELTDATGTVITTIDTYENGEQFNGFSSNNVYFSFDAKGIGASGLEVMVTRINNQGTNITRNDYQEPDIIVNGRVASRVPCGTTITLPTASGYDVLNSVGELTVSVKMDDGTVILAETKADTVQTITLNQIGTYVVTYTLTDSSGNSAERVYVITAYDDIKPSLTFNGSMPTEVKAGSTVKLPSYTVQDNDDVSTVTVAAYLYCPDGTVKDIKNNTATFSDKGTYLLVYLATDKNNNSTVYSFRIVAK